MRRIVLLATILVVSACGDDSTSSTSGEDATSSGGEGGGNATSTTTVAPTTSVASTSGGSGGSDGTGGAGGEAPSTARTLVGELHWLKHDIENDSDCTFTYVVDGIEDRSTPWQCPGAEVAFRSPREIIDSDCPPSEPPPGDPRPAEEIAIAIMPGGDLCLATGFNPGTTIGVAATEGPTLEATISLAVPGFEYSGQGTFDLGEVEADPYAGFVAAESYACGWPKGDPPPFEGSYATAPAVGELMPDGVFLDACGDHVRLHDLLGRYLVIVLTQTEGDTCTPCRDVSLSQAEFEAEIADAGVELLAVDLLVPTFFESYLEPTLAEIQTFREATEVAGVVLADRGFAGIAGLAGLPPGSQLAYPAMIAIRPDGTVLLTQQGSDPDAGDHFGTVRAAILADAAQ